MRVLLPILANGIDNYIIVFVHDSTHTDNDLDNNRTFVNPIIYDIACYYRVLGEGYAINLL